MSIFWIALPAAIACGILAGIDKGRALRKAQEAMQQTETETGGAPGEISEILVPVYTKLRRAGASCRPWIHDCIVAIEAGQGCDPEIAIAALTETGEDLAGSRWDTDEMAETFGQAAEKLAALI